MLAAARQPCHNCPPCLLSLLALLSFACNECNDQQPGRKRPGQAGQPPGNCGEREPSRSKWPLIIDVLTDLDGSGPLPSATGSWQR
jgi:hypothetical protein